MIKKFNKKGVGWMPDDLASIVFALLLISAAFIAFNHVNELVAKPSITSAYINHQLYEQQRLLHTYLQTPVVLDGKQGDAQTFLAEFILLDYWQTQYPKDTSEQQRIKDLESDFIEDEFRATINYYQPLSEELYLGQIYAKDAYFVIKLIETSTGKEVHSYSYPVTLRRQGDVQATAAIPTPKIKDYGPNQYIVVVELRIPDIKNRGLFMKTLSQVAQRGVVSTP